MHTGGLTLSAPAALEGFGIITPSPYQTYTALAYGGIFLPEGEYPQPDWTGSLPLDAAGLHATMTKPTPYVFEDTPAGRSLVVTSAWSAEAADSLARGEADGLVLNYARGFTDQSLEPLDAAWGLRRLDVLDRAITDLAPIGRLSESLEDLSIQAAPQAELDLGVVPRLRALAGEWGLIGGTLGELDELEEVVTWRFDEVDLHAFRDHVELRHLTVKDASHLESLAGVGNLPELEELNVLLARRLSDISEVAELASTLRRFQLQDCPSIGAIDDVEPLVNLRFLGISECGDIESFAPIKELQKLESLYAWGSTRVVDDDLSPIAQLSQLTDFRMQDRRRYRPRVAELKSSLSSAA
jgi:hypothetical protein